jgi:hypothetical protein
MNCLHQTGEQLWFENGAFSVYYVAHRGNSRMGIMARGKLLHESLLFLFYFEAWAYMSIVLEFNCCI